MPAPAIIKNASVTFSATEHAAVLKVARLVPDVTTASYPTLIPTGNRTDVGSAVWTLELEGLQDHTTGGLAKFLTDNHGVAVSVVIKPFAETGERQATVSVIGQAVPFGGEVNEYADFQVTLGVVGQPTWADIA